MVKDRDTETKTNIDQAISTAMAAPMCTVIANMVRARRFLAISNTCGPWASKTLFVRSDSSLVEDRLKPVLGEVAVWQNHRPPVLIYSYRLQFCGPA